MRRLLESRSACREVAGIAFLLLHPGESKFQVLTEHLAFAIFQNRISTAC